MKDNKTAGVNNGITDIDNRITGINNRITGGNSRITGGDNKIEGVSNKITDLNVLYEAFLASMKGSAWKEEPQKFEMDFLSEIVKLKQELETREYRTMPGSEFTLNERGKIRYIHGGRMRDRVVRHALCDAALDEALKPYLIHNNSASQRGKGVSFARKMFERDLHNYWLEYRTNQGYVGFVDFSKFYDNIRHDRAKEMVSARVDEFCGWLFGQIVDTFQIDVSYMNDEEYADCINQRFDSVKYHESIPEEWRTGQKFMAKSADIGDQVSQDIGIFYPAQIDNYAKIVRGAKMYGRYMDDIYIIGETREYITSVIRGITEQAGGLGIFINERKTRIVELSRTFKYLQIRYRLADSGRVIKRIHPKAVTRERRKLKAYKRLCEKGGIEYAAVEQAYKSWMGANVPVMSKKQVKNMKQLYKELFGKEPRWKKQK